MSTTKVFTASVKDGRSVSLYDVATGQYEGIIFVTSGEITGNPIVTPTTLSVTFIENGKHFISTYSLPDRNFIRKIGI